MKVKEVLKTGKDVEDFITKNPFDCMITEMNSEERTIYYQYNTDVPLNVKDLANNENMTLEEISSTLNTSGTKTSLIIAGENKFLLIHREA